MDGTKNSTSWPVRCTHCGNWNTLPSGPKAANAICIKCARPLFDKEAESGPSTPASESDDELKPVFTITPRLLRSPTDFEEAAADWMRVWGFPSVMRTNPGRDGGIDVESINAVAQVKAWMVPVGSPEVQQLKGAALGRLALFFSLTDYTAAAVKFADQAGVALFRFCGYYGEIEAVNGVAKTWIVTRNEGLIDSNSQSLESEESQPPEPEEAQSCEPEVKSSTIRELIERNLAWLLRHPPAIFILEVKESNRYVQAASGWGGDFSVEAVSNEFLEEDRLTASETLSLVQLGWPANRPGENYRLEFDTEPHWVPDDKREQYLAQVAELLERTLIEVFGASTPEDIVTKN